MSIEQCATEVVMGVYTQINKRSRERGFTQEPSKLDWEDNLVLVAERHQLTALEIELVIARLTSVVDGLQGYVDQISQATPPSPSR